MTYVMPTDPPQKVHMKVTVIAFTVAGGAVTAIRTLTDPDRLAQVVPSWVA
jgi:hypothetical protein